MAHNPKYDYFAEFVDAHIGKRDFQGLIKEFRKDIYTKDPQQIIDKVEDFFRDKWIASAEAKPARGDAQTQFNNFQKFIHGEVLTRDKLTFKDPYDKRKVIDWTPMFAKYRELTGEYIKEPTISPRISKTVKLVKPEIVGKDNLIKEINKLRKLRGYTPEDEATLKKLNIGQLRELWYEQQVKKVNPTVFYKRIDKQIENSEKGQNVDNLIAIRDAMRDMVYLPEKRKPLSSFEAHELYAKANKALEPYFEKGSRLSAKSDEQLLNSLALEGVDISNLKTTKDIRVAAKDAGIGIRQYQKTRNELISGIASISPKFSKRELDKKPDSYLRDVWKNLNRELRKPTKKFYVKYEDLPTDTERVEQLYKDRNQTITPEEKAEVTSQIEKYFPFLTPNEVTQEVNQQLAAKATGLPIFGRELERRYMEQKYGDPNLKPKFLDLINISNLTHKEFRSLYATKTQDVVDSITGKKKKVKDALPKNAFKPYRDYLRDKIIKGKRAVDIKGEEQEESFVGSAEEEAIQDILGGFI